jgi:hypothetical protein
MKRFVFPQWVSAAVILAAISISATAHAAPILEGYYTFSNSGNLGEDFSGNGNNLTATAGVSAVTGGPAFNGTNGSSATSPAAAFNGSTGLLTTTSGNVPSGFPTGNGTYTITAWVNTGTSSDGFGSNGGIIGWGNYNNDRQVNAFRLNGGGQGFQNYWWNDDLVNGSATTVDSTWHMLAATYDGTTRSLYEDGVLVSSDLPLTSPNAGSNPGPANVGTANFAIGRTFGNEFFQGDMADVAVYSGALTQTQLAGIFDGKLNAFLQAVPEPSSIAALCGLGAMGLFFFARRRKGGPASAPGSIVSESTGAQPSHLKPSGDRSVWINFKLLSFVAALGLALEVSTAQGALVHEYSFNGNANDSIGGANGTLSGGATISGGQLNTTGPHGDGVSLPAAATNGISGDFTIEQWFTRADTVNNYASLFTISTDQSHFLIANPERPGNGVPGNDLSIDFDNGSGEVHLYTNGSQAAGSEHMIAITYNATTQTASLYLDGNLVPNVAGSQGTLNIGAFNLSTINGNNTNTGINDFSPYGDPSFNGSTDEFRIYNDAQSAGQILADFQQGPNLPVLAH